MLNRKAHVAIWFIMLAVVLQTAACRKSPEQRAENVIDAMAQRLDLNDEQREKLRAMKEEFFSRAPAMREVREDTYDQLLAFMKNSQIDPEAMNRLVEKNKAEASRFIEFISAKFTEFHNMLTPEQRQKAAAEMERWRERYREHDDKGRR